MERRKATSTLRKKENEQNVRKRKTKAEVLNRTKRINVNGPFRVKKMNIRIQVCQGCRQDMKIDGQIPPPPFDYCIARVESNSYKDKVSGETKMGRATDAHYHLKISCIRNVEPSFMRCFLQIPEEVPEEYKNFIVKEFN